MTDDESESAVESIPAPAINRAVVAHRVVQAGLLLALIWKWSFFAGAVRVYSRVPLTDSFFPLWLQSNWTVSIAYLVTVGAVVLSLVTASHGLQRVCSWLALIGSSILCIHQGSYNDMTFVTAWWTSLWTLWYVHHLADADTNEILRRGAFLSRVIVSVILLGGASGKWTSEYWSGDVFYDIYFLDRDFWLFNLLRSNFEPDTLRDIATWYSRQVIVIETIGGLGLWLLPPKWAALVGVVLLLSIAIFSNFLLFSVLLSLVGLAAVGFLVQRRTE